MLHFKSVSILTAYASKEGAGSWDVDVLAFYPTKLTSKNLSGTLSE